MVCGKVKDIPEIKRKTLLSQLTTTLDIKTVILIIVIICVF